MDYDFIKKKGHNDFQKPNYNNTNVLEQTEASLLPIADFNSENNDSYDKENNLNQGNIFRKSGKQ